MHRMLAASFATICFMSSVASGQSTDAPAATSPKTKMEAFTGTTGVVSIKGYQEIGKIRAQYGAIEVRAMSFRNAATNAAQSGVVIGVAELGRLDKPTNSFLDYDEIQGLLDGIDYLLKLPATVTEYPQFEARYTTKGELSIVVYNRTDGTRSAAISSGRFGGQQVYLTLDELSRLKNMIVEARATVDDPAAARKAAAAKAEQEAARQARERASRAAAEKRATEPLKRPPSPKPTNIDPPKQ